MRLLIVDDSAGDRQLCRILMEEAGDPSLERSRPAMEPPDWKPAARSLPIAC